MAVRACQWSGVAIRHASTSFISSSLRWSPKVRACAAFAFAWSICDG